MHDDGDAVKEEDKNKDSDQSNSASTVEKQFDV